MASLEVIGEDGENHIVKARLEIGVQCIGPAVYLYLAAIVHNHRSLAVRNPGVDWSSFSLLARGAEEGWAI